MLLYWIWLTTRRGLGNRGALAALAQLASPDAVFRADAAELALVPGLSDRERKALADKTLAVPKRILEQCSQKGIHMLTYQDAAYPDRLRNIDDPPMLLYYVGTLPVFDAEPVIGVVGTRNASAAGLLIAKRLGYQIAACGGVVVSGLAKGVDAMAMIGAVTAGRPVIGVLGGGVDVVYPRCNQSLFEDVQRYGCLLSEYAPGAPTEPHNFPARNRIISGLSVGVLVIEAPEKSGALITARRALEQGRDVFTVPGSIDQANYVGSNRLLKEGAYMVETGWDVMQEYLHLYPERIKQTMLGKDLTLAMDELREHAEPYLPHVAQPTHAPQQEKPVAPEFIDVEAVLPGLTADEAAILKALQDKPLSVDELVEQLQKTAPAVLSSLTLLQVKGFVDRLPASRFSLAKKS